MYVTDAITALAALKTALASTQRSPLLVDQRVLESEL